MLSEILNFFHRSAAMKGSLLSLNSVKFQVVFFPYLIRHFAAGSSEQENWTIEKPSQFSRLPFTDNTYLCKEHLSTIARRYEG